LKNVTKFAINSSSYRTHLQHVKLTRLSNSANIYTIIKEVIVTCGATLLNVLLYPRILWAVRRMPVVNLSIMAIRSDIRRNFEEFAAMQDRLRCINKNMIDSSILMSYPIPSSQGYAARVHLPAPALLYKESSTHTMLIASLIR
jgi:hypothetical protein